MLLIFLSGICFNNKQLFSEIPGDIPQSSVKPLYDFLTQEAIPAPVFDYRLPRNVTVAVGQSAFLKCKVFARENRTVSRDFSL